MRMRKGAIFAVMAAGLVACSSAPSGPAPIATISVNSNAVSAVESAPAAAEAQPAGTVTFIEFYAEW